MISLLRSYKQWLTWFVAGLICTALFTFGLPIVWQQPTLTQAASNDINVILMIGDGMGWEMARAAALAKGAPFYPSGRGQGLSLQTLSGYTYMTTYGTTVQGNNGRFSTGNSALDDSKPVTGESPIRPGFVFNPAFNPGNTPTGGSTSGGNLVGYDPARGGPNPWTPGNDKEYIKWSYPDSANTATAMYTGIKSFNNAMGVDLLEQAQETILQKAAKKGKSTGLVTSVPISHATPGAAASSVNRRSKYDNDFPALDNILQEALRPDQGYLPTVLIGGGHPLDFENTSNVGPVFKYTYIKKSTYDELRTKPTSNRYGYRFLERGPNAAASLLNAATTVDPNAGQRLLGVYGARGQNGNIPISTANGDYSSTGFDNFSLYSTAVANKQVPKPDTVRPLAPGETDAQFIAREVNENPTLADMTQAALTVLSKDPDGFWLMVEGGDIDWACHDDNMDNLIGTMNDFDKAIQTVINWINQNGGWSKNMLIVTADHDHYLTLNPNFPELLAQKGAEALTYTEHNPAGAGHFWGSDPNIKYGWGNHSNRMVPVYYQGGPISLANYVGRGITAYGSTVPGTPTAIDQTHIFEVMNAALNAKPRVR